MRWIWIDRFVAFESGRSATAVKSLSLAEDHFARVDCDPGGRQHPNERHFHDSGRTPEERFTILNRLMRGASSVKMASGRRF